MPNNRNKESVIEEASKEVEKLCSSGFSVSRRIYDDCVVVEANKTLYIDTSKAVGFEFVGDFICPDCGHKTSPTGYSSFSLKCINNACVLYDIVFNIPPRIYMSRMTEKEKQDGRIAVAIKFGEI